MRIPYTINNNGKIIPELQVRGVRFTLKKNLPNPTTVMLNNDPLFEAIWEVIKDWDINVPDYYVGYMGGTGSHVALIYQAIKTKGL